MWKISLLLLPLLGVCLVSSTPSSKINSNLLSTLASKGTTNVMISFVGGTQRIVNLVETQSFTNRADKLTTLKLALTRQAQSSQNNLQDFLQAKGVSFKSFWITNQFLIKNANRQLLEEIASFPEVSELYEEHVMELEPMNLSDIRTTAVESWGLTRIQAEEAWRITNGSGVLVAGIDTGVRHTHEALRSNFRADYGWLDPVDGLAEPYDEIGHGTHTIGTIVGSHGVGVAPGAEWIACKGCIVGCAEEWLLACGEWVLCPTKPDGSDPDCSKAPMVVSNSWGGAGGSKWFEPVTQAWVAADIVPIFATGNQGPECGTSHSPGDLDSVIAAGSIGEDNSLSRFSSVGPSKDGLMKPDMSAPGEAIYSAVANADDAYGRMSGTSMATPHVSGVTALLLSINRNMTFTQVRQALIDGCDSGIRGRGDECGGRDDGTLPNHFFGHGVINALQVVEAAQKAIKN